MQLFLSDLVDLEMMKIYVNACSVKIVLCNLRKLAMALGTVSPLVPGRAMAPDLEVRATVLQFLSFFTISFMIHNNILLRRNNNSILNS